MLPIRHTKQRKAILDAMRSGKLNHPSADELYVYIRKIIPNISLGTVYRNLNLLSSSGEILKIQIPNAPDRFDYNTFTHSHLLCSKCGMLFDIQSQNFHSDISKKIERSGFVLHSLTITARGICPNCKTKK